MLKKIFFGIDLWRAYSLASSNNIVKALSILDKYMNEMDKYENKFPDYYILRASLNYELKNYAQSKKDLESVTVLLTKNNYYSFDEKMYLYSYIYNLLANIEYKNNNKIWKEYDMLSKRDNYNIDFVGSNLKNNFPLS